MANFTKCTICVKEGLTVPISREGHNLVCVLSGTSYQIPSTQEE